MLILSRYRSLRNDQDSSKSGFQGRYRIPMLDRVCCYARKYPWETLFLLKEDISSRTFQSNQTTIFLFLCSLPQWWLATSSQRWSRRIWHNFWANAAWISTGCESNLLPPPSCVLYLVDVRARLGSMRCLALNSKPVLSVDGELKILSSRWNDSESVAW